MAQVARDERQAMRQRGAGSRNVNDLDFNLDLAAGSREERRLMRQRGAGNREVNNIDFGFAFATPSRFTARRSRTRSKTPGTVGRAPPKSNGRNTPLPTIPPSSIRSQRTQRTSSIAPHLPAGRPSSQPQRKRRRLSEVSNITQATSLDIPLASEPGLLDEQDGNAPPFTAGALKVIQNQSRQSSSYNVPSSPLFVPRQSDEDVEADKENYPAPSQITKPASKKRKRRSIGQQSLFKKKTSSRSSDTPVPSVQVAEELQEHEVSLRDTSNIPSPDELPALQDESGEQFATRPSPATQLQNTADVPSLSKAKRRKKRKSIAAPKKKRRSNSTIASTGTRSPQAATPQNDEGPAQLMDDEPTPDPGYDSEERPSASTSPIVEPAGDDAEDGPRSYVRDDEAADDTYLPDEATPEPTPAPKRIREKQKSKQNTQAKRGRTAVAGRRERESFPILTHRMTNAHTLPTIMEETETQMAHEEGQSSSDELSRAPPPTIVTRAAPNAVDVLAQACRETIDASVQKLKEDATGQGRASISRQIDALQTFRSNLEVRLFDLSQSLDQRLHMEARLRKSRREKAELQARWLEVRKQRDVMALKMDAVRRQHWETEISRRKAWDISQAAHRLDTAVNRDDGHVDDRSKADVLEFSLREVGHDVSSRDGRGILNVLKQFNVQLEQAANGLS